MGFMQNRHSFLRSFAQTGFEGLAQALARTAQLEGEAEAAEVEARDVPTSQADGAQLSPKMT